MVESWDAVIDEIGGTAAVAGGLKEALSTVSGWRSRGIPSPHWARVVRLASDLGKTAVTLDALAALAERKLVGSEVRA